MKYQVLSIGLADLDLAVAKAVGLVPVPHQPPGFFYWTERGAPCSGWWAPSTVWEQGGPIIEGVDLVARDGAGWWRARALRPGAFDAEWWGGGPTMLVAGLRAFLAAKYGPEVELP